MRNQTVHQCAKTPHHSRANLTVLFKSEEVHYLPPNTAERRNPCLEQRVLLNPNKTPAKEQFRRKESQSKLFRMRIPVRSTPHKQTTSVNAPQEVPEAIPIGEWKWIHQNSTAAICEIYLWHHWEWMTHWCMYLHHTIVQHTQTATYSSTFHLQLRSCLNLDVSNNQVQDQSYLKNTIWFSPQTVVLAPQMLADHLFTNFLPFLFLSNIWTAFKPSSQPSSWTFDTDLSKIVLQIFGSCIAAFRSVA